MGGVTGTLDPHVKIEERREGYVRYRQLDPRTGTVIRRWEVHGTCVKLGHCMVGAVVEDERVLEDLEEARAYILEHPLAVDSPVTPEFGGCCPFTYVELRCADQ